MCNYGVDENTETLVELCVPWGSVPPLKIQGFLDAQVCYLRSQLLLEI